MLSERRIVPCTKRLLQGQSLPLGGRRCRACIVQYLAIQCHQAPLPFWTQVSAVPMHAFFFDRGGAIEGRGDASFLLRPGLLWLPGRLPAAPALPEPGSRTWIKKAHHTLKLAVPPRSLFFCPSETSQPVPTPLSRLALAFWLALNCLRSSLAGVSTSYPRPIHPRLWPGLGVSRTAPCTHAMYSCTSLPFSIARCTRSSPLWAVLFLLVLPASRTPPTTTTPTTTTQVLILPSSHPQPVCVDTSFIANIHDRHPCSTSSSLFLSSFLIIILAASYPLFPSSLSFTSCPIFHSSELVTRISLLVVRILSSESPALPFASFQHACLFVASCSVTTEPSIVLSISLCSCLPPPRASAHPNTRNCTTTISAANAHQSTV